MSAGLRSRVEKLEEQRPEKQPILFYCINLGGAANRSDQDRLCREYLDANSALENRYPRKGERLVLTIFMDGASLRALRGDEEAPRKEAKHDIVA